MTETESRGGSDWGDALSITGFIVALSVGVWFIADVRACQYALAVASTPEQFAELATMRCKPK